jgi:hypothetical protein
LSVAALVAALLVSTVADGQTPRNSCSECKMQGFKPCKSKDCKPDRHCGISIEHKCDALFAAKCCRGMQQILCPKCKDPILAVDNDAELQSRAAWVERMRKFDDECQTRFSHVETSRWIVHCSFPDWKVGDVVLSRSKTAHLFAERLETMTARLEGIFGGSSSKHSAFVVWTGQEMMRTTLTQQGVGYDSMPHMTYNTNGKMTLRPRQGMGGSDLGTKNDDTFHPHLLHAGAHLVTQAMFGIKQDFVQWIDEAISHWYEIAFFEKQATFCMREINNNKDPWRSTDWKKQIYGEVTTKKEEQFAKLITYQNDKLAPRDKAHCWSYVEFLISAHPEEFKTFFRELKSTNDTKKALDKALGWSTATFQEKWREHVLKTYAP